MAKTLDQRERVERIEEYYIVNREFGRVKAFRREYHDTQEQERRLEIIRKYEVQQMGRSLQ